MHSMLSLWASVLSVHLLWPSFPLVAGRVAIGLMPKAGQRKHGVEIIMFPGRGNQWENKDLLGHWYRCLSRKLNGAITW